MPIFCTEFQWLKVLVPKTRQVEVMELVIPLSMMHHLEFRVRLCAHEVWMEWPLKFWAYRFAIILGCFWLPRQTNWNHQLRQLRISALQSDWLVEHVDHSSVLPSRSPLIGSLCFHPVKLHTEFIYGNCAKFKTNLISNKISHRRDCHDDTRGD